MYDCLSDMHTINYNTADMGDPCVGFWDELIMNYIRFWLGWYVSWNYPNCDELHECLREIVQFIVPIWTLFYLKGDIKKAKKNKLFYMNSEVLYCEFEFHLSPDSFQMSYTIFSLVGIELTIR